MYIRTCNSITDRDIVRAAEAGARSADDLACHLGVGMGSRIIQKVGIENYQQSQMGSPS